MKDFIIHSPASTMSISILMSCPLATQTSDTLSLHSKEQNEKREYTFLEYTAMVLFVPTKTCGTQQKLFLEETLWPWNFYCSVENIPQLTSLKHLLSLIVSLGKKVEWLGCTVWLSVFHEVAVTCQPGKRSSEGWTGVGGSTYKVALLQGKQVVTDFCHKALVSLHQHLH